MKHEPECFMVADVWLVGATMECAVCDAIRAAYQRGVARSRERAQEAHLAGFHDGYERGREDAGNSVHDALIDGAGGDTSAVTAAILAAIPEDRRGGIEQGVIWQITGDICAIAVTAARGIDTTK